MTEGLKVAAQIVYVPQRASSFRNLVEVRDLGVVHLVSTYPKGLLHSAIMTEELNSIESMFCLRTPKGFFIPQYHRRSYLLWSGFLSTYPKGLLHSAMAQRTTEALVLEKSTYPKGLLHSAISPTGRWRKPDHNVYVPQRASSFRNTRSFLRSRFSYRVYVPQRASSFRNVSASGGGSWGF